VNDHIQILNRFKETPYEILGKDKDKAKLIAAINKSIKLLQRDSSRKADRR
jgi:hypothetical protein